MTNQELPVPSKVPAYVLLARRVLTSFLLTFMATRILVFLIVDLIEGQEERNADHLLEEGVALRCNNLPVLGYKADLLLSDPKRLKRMQQNARRLARPRAAFTIVDSLLGE